MRSVGHSVEREEQEEQLEAAEGPEQAVEPGQPSVGSVGLDEVVDYEAACQESKSCKETVAVVGSGHDVIGGDLVP